MFNTLVRMFVRAPVDAVSAGSPPTPAANGAPTSDPNAASFDDALAAAARETQPSGTPATNPTDDPNNGTLYDTNYAHGYPVVGNAANGQAPIVPASQQSLADNRITEDYDTYRARWISDQGTANTGATLTNNDPVTGAASLASTALPNGELRVLYDGDPGDPSTGGSAPDHPGLTSDGKPTTISSYHSNSPQDHTDNTISEGMGYGMLQAVANNDQATFQGLDQYVQDHLKPDGLLPFKLESNGTPDFETDASNSTNGGSQFGSASATDGDEDIAYSLLEAGSKWNNQDYINQGTDMAHAILTHDMDTPAYTDQAGDKIGGTFPVGSDPTNPANVTPARDNVLGGDPDNQHTPTSPPNPSYFAPSEYRDFELAESRDTRPGTAATYNAEAPEWDQIIKQGYALNNDATDPGKRPASENSGGFQTDTTGKTGLEPQNVNPVDGTPGGGALDFQYDSFREPYRETLDKLYNGLAPGFGTAGQDFANYQAKNLDQAPTTTDSTNPHVDSLTDAQFQDRTAAPVVNPQIYNQRQLGGAVENVSGYDAQGNPTSYNQAEFLGVSGVSQLPDGVANGTDARQLYNDLILSDQGPATDPNTLQVTDPAGQLKTTDVKDKDYYSSPWSLFAQETLTGNNPDFYINPTGKTNNSAVDALHAANLPAFQGYAGQ